MEDLVVGSIRAPLLPTDENETERPISTRALSIDIGAPHHEMSNSRQSPRRLNHTRSIDSRRSRLASDTLLPEDHRPSLDFSVPRRWAEPESQPPMRQYQHHRKFDVIEIRAGRLKRLSLQTPELLREVHYHNKTKNLEDTKSGSLKLRDLRQVCTSTTIGSERASIEARRNCVLINMPPFTKCIVLHDRVYFVLRAGDDLDNRVPILAPPASSSRDESQPLLDDENSRQRTLSLGAQFHRLRAGLFNRGQTGEGPPGAYTVAPSTSLFSWRQSMSKIEADSTLVTSLIPDSPLASLEDALIEKLRQLSEIKTNAPFEFAVIEAVLVEVCTELIGEAYPIKRAADQALEALGCSPSGTVLLHRISALKHRVDAAIDRVRGVNKAMEEVLGNEEDLRRLEISRFWDKPEEWDDPPDSVNAEDLEILLENYVQEVESLQRLLRRVDEELDDALRFMELHLATVRNTFLKVEIGLDVVGVFITFVGVIAGIYGMNIPNGWEENSNAFAPFGGGLLITCCLVPAAAFFFFRRLRL
eukprot:GHVO01022643.1.p1 GENE.GHVO01022643.1~~GHVO01022643.1.p1  ORF type:complete len:531 (+),score=98.48 GHVO01022643.1:66-1658(+)